MAEYTHCKHEFEPLFDSDSQILILGSFPSVKSREEGFYYGHPRNRFWRVLAELLQEEIPQSVEEKKEFLKKHHIALWDVIDSCDIMGSSDSSITNVIPTDIPNILARTKIKAIFANGNTAAKWYQKLTEPRTKISPIILPSTSPANAAYSVERLVDCWNIILEYLG